MLLESPQHENHLNEAGVSWLARAESKLERTSGWLSTSFSGPKMPCPWKILITWGCWRIFPVLSSMKARSAERGWKVWGYAILAGCCTSFALQSMKIESSWQWILTIIWQFNSEMKHPLSLRCHKSYVSNEGMKRDAIQQSSTFHIRNLLHHKVFTLCNLLCQQPFTTLRKVLQREGFRPTTFSCPKKGWKTQRNQPPTLASRSPTFTHHTFVSEKKSADYQFQPVMSIQANVHILWVQAEFLLLAHWPNDTSARTVSSSIFNDKKVVFMPSIWEAFPT